MFGKKSEPVDRRLYIANPALWKVRVKEDWNKENCYHKNEDEDYFHSIVKGEIFFENGTEKVCMNCAIKNNLLTDNRFHWQRESGEAVAEIDQSEAENLENPESE